MSSKRPDNSKILTNIHSTTNVSIRTNILLLFSEGQRGRGEEKRGKRRDKERGRKETEQIS